MRKGIKTFKKFKDKFSRSPSPNPSAGTGSQAPSDLAPTPLSVATGGIAILSAQGPSSDPRAILLLQPEPGNTGVPDIESLVPPGDSRATFAIESPVPTISVQPPSDVYADLISPSDGGDGANPASIGFQGFKTVLTAVREAGDAFPPLKSVAGGLLGLIDIVEVRDFDRFFCHHLRRPCLQTTYQNKEDRVELERRVGAVVHILESHQPNSLSPRRLERLHGLAMFVFIYYRKIIN
jgi:hypothetical protein